MTISASTSSIPLLKRIDELAILNFPHLQPSDEIYYYGEYTSGKAADFSPMNQLIRNYNKKLSRMGQPDWHFKEEAIKTSANLLRVAILQSIGIRQRINNAILVPVPPSLSKDAPEYDDRNLKMLNYLRPQGNIRELILQKQSRTPLKETKVRDPKKLESNYYLNPSTNIDFGNSEIWLFDDVLTQGTHFRAIHDFLKAHDPKVKITGFFLARSVYPS